jgi:hypothetical protein
MVLPPPKSLVVFFVAVPARTDFDTDNFDAGAAEATTGAPTTAAAAASANMFLNIFIENTLVEMAYKKHVVTATYVSPLQPNVPIGHMVIWSDAPIVWKECNDPLASLGRLTQ